MQCVIITPASYTKQKKKSKTKNKKKTKYPHDIGEKTARDFGPVLHLFGGGLGGGGASAGPP